MICGGVQSTFSVLEPSEVKFPALRGFVLPTDIHVSRGTRLVSSGLSTLLILLVLTEDISANGISVNIYKGISVNISEDICCVPC